MRRYFHDVITGKTEGFIAFVIRAVLIFLSLFYGIAVWLRRILYNTGVLKAGELSRPVISVGNITWGGTGKTPLVEAIFDHFADKGKRVTLLTRGYGADEDRLLSEAKPNASVLAGKRRLDNARVAEKVDKIDLFI